MVHKSLFKNSVNLLFKSMGVFKEETNVLWGRWCLPSFNKNCDQILKGKLADYDNNLCNGKPVSITYNFKYNK
tara:strand:+ start:342 stop:560 length:219 start_codon:yes stop_codon:yes gene_type:complete